MASLQAQRRRLQGRRRLDGAVSNFWEESFDRLDAYLKTVTANKESERKEKCPQKISRTRSEIIRDLRCAGESRLGRLDRSGASGAVVGTARLHAHHARAKICGRAGIGTTPCTAPMASITPTRPKYFEVEKHAKLVYDHGGNDDRPPLFRVTVLFSEADGKTKMEMTMTLADAGSGRGDPQIHQEGGRRFDLGSARGISGKRVLGQGEVRHQSQLRCAAGTMFEMWTDPKHFPMAAPTGFTMQFIRCDIKPGGQQLLCHDGCGRRQNVRPGRILEDREARPASFTRNSSATKTKKSPAIRWPHLAGNHADDRAIDGGRTGPNPRDRHLGTLRVVRRAKSSKPSSKPEAA